MSIRRSPLAVTLPGVALALLVLGSTASAQTQSLFGGTGGTGGAAGGGAAGGGTAQAANAQAGAFEQGGPQLTTELGTASQSAGQQTFLGRGAGTAMVGNAGAQGGAAAGGQNNIPDFSAGGGGGRGGNGGNAGRGNNDQGRRSVIRPVLRIGFDYPRMPTVAVDTNLRARVTRIAERRPEFAGVTHRVDEVGNTVVSGIVRSEADAKLALALARLEPGVRKVEGDFTIQTPPVPADR